MSDLLCVAVRKRNLQSFIWGSVGGHNGAERGPADSEGTREMKSKHSTSSIQDLRMSPGRFVETSGDQMTSYM